MNHIVKGRDYWFVAGIVALSITLKICSIVALYNHLENRNTPGICIINEQKW